MKIFKNAITEKLYAILDEDYEKAIRSGAKEASFLNTEDKMRYTIPFADMELLENFDINTLDVKARVLMGDTKVDSDKFLSKIATENLEKEEDGYEQG